MEVQVLDYFTSVHEQRTCKSCLELKSIEDFYKYPQGGIAYKCTKCFRAQEKQRQKDLWANNPKYRERHNEYGKSVRRGLEPVRATPKIRADKSTCKVCKVEKDTVDFFHNGKNYLHTCKSCYLEKQREKDKLRYIKRKFIPKDAKTYDNRKVTGYYERLYGVDFETVKEALVRQDNRCANKACNVEISLSTPKELAKSAVLDHNHETGEFRSLLCKRCNIVLGHHENNPGLFNGLIDYLDSFS